MKPTVQTHAEALYQGKKGKTALWFGIETTHGLCLLSGYIPFSSQQIYDSSTQLVEFWLIVEVLLSNINREVGYRADIILYRILKYIMSQPFTE